MYMKDWVERLKTVLTMNQKSILQDAGRISHKMVIEKAETEFNQYKAKELEQQHLESIKELDADLKKLQRTE